MNPWEQKLGNSNTKEIASLKLELERLEKEYKSLRENIVQNQILAENSISKEAMKDFERTTYNTFCSITKAIEEANKELSELENTSNKLENNIIGLNEALTQEATLKQAQFKALEQRLNTQYNGELINLTKRQDSIKEELFKKVELQSLKNNQLERLIQSSNEQNNKAYEDLEDRTNTAFERTEEKFEKLEQELSNRNYQDPETKASIQYLKESENCFKNDLAKLKDDLKKIENFDIETIDVNVMDLISQVHNLLKELDKIDAAQESIENKFDNKIDKLSQYIDTLSNILWNLPITGDSFGLRLTSKKICLRADDIILENLSNPDNTTLKEITKVMHDRISSLENKYISPPALEFKDLKGQTHVIPQNNITSIACNPVSKTTRKWPIETINSVFLVCCAIITNVVAGYFSITNNVMDLGAFSVTSIFLWIIMLTFCSFETNQVTNIEYWKLIVETNNAKPKTYLISNDDVKEVLSKSGYSNPEEFILCQITTLS